jgi:hypothetical protein
MVFGPGRRVARRTGRRVARRQGMLEESEAPPTADAPPPAQPAAPAGAGDVDPAEELRKLAELHEQGILTDEEFAAKKKQILGI